MKVSNKKTALLLMAAAAVVFVLPLFSKTLAVLFGFGLVLAILNSAIPPKWFKSGHSTSVREVDSNAFKPLPTNPIARIVPPVGNVMPVLPRDDM